MDTEAILRECVAFRVKLSRDTGTNLTTAACLELLGVTFQGDRSGEEVSLESNPGRGLHSFTSQLNLSAFYGIGDARRDCVARVWGVLGGFQGVCRVCRVFLCVRHGSS